VGSICCRPQRNETPRASIHSDFLLSVHGYEPPCIAENKEPPNTPATPAMWNGCIKCCAQLGILT
jgi:hypothetical protein